MKVKDFMILVLAILLCITSNSNGNSIITVASSLVTISILPKDPFFGIPPQDEDYYSALSSGSIIKCKDGSKKFSKSMLNDDFCDCPDASDEPGTSACPNGKFYCLNAGHTPVVLFSSRVNDGICDCCDGSDEYDGQVSCPNTCWEAGKVAREKLKKKISTYKEGVALRNQLVEQAKQAIAKDEAELSKLKGEEKILKGLVEQLKERKELIEKAEEKERLQKEKEEKERKEAEKKVNAEKTQTGEEAKEENAPNEVQTENEGEHIESADNDQIGTLDDSPLDQDEPFGPVDPAVQDEHGATSENEESQVKVEKHATKEEEKPVISQSEAATEDSHDAGKQQGDVSENAEGLSKEELGRLVAARWTGNAEKESKENDGAKDDGHEDVQPDDTQGEEEEDGYASETDDDTGKYDDPDMEDDRDETFEDDIHGDVSSSYKLESDDDLESSDISSPSSPSWLDKIQQTVRNILHAVNLFQTPVNISDAAQVRKEYDDSSSKLSKLQSRISKLTEKLKHDFGKENEFYSFYDNCFESKQNKYVYKVCPFKQASQMEGHSTTRLGRWDKFEDSYHVMVFSEGDRCWNGPDRSLKVKLRCGLKNEVTDIDEPSRCEYVALLSTPALCAEEKLKALEEKLELFNKDKPSRHDEL